MSKAESGALSPVEAAQETLETAVHHLNEPSQLALLKNIYGGLLLSMGGIAATVASGGCPSLANSNPGLPRILNGLIFPLGLVFIYFVGAELYTGYPMWLTMAVLSRKGTVGQYLRALLIPWLGNLVGALLTVFMFTYGTKVVSEDPYKSKVIEELSSTIITAPWHTILLKATGCGFMVTLAMFIGTQNRDGISKALGLHLPFFITITSGFPHTVEYMWMAPTAMLMGAKLSIGGFLWKCMLPISLGNLLGGALFTGAYNWYVYLECDDGKKSRDWFTGQQEDGETVT